MSLSPSPLLFGLKLHHGLAHLCRSGCSRFPQQVGCQRWPETSGIRLALRRAARLSNALVGQGLRLGTRVGVRLGNRVEHVEVDLALALSGMVRVALKPSLSLTEFERIVVECGVRALVTDVPMTAWLEERSDREGDMTLIHVGSEARSGSSFEYESLIASASSVPPALPDLSDNAAWIYYTSGTTANPKGVILSHQAVVRALRGLTTTLGFTNSSRLHVPLHLSEANGYYALACLGRGGQVRIDAQYSTDRLAHVATEGIDTVHLTARQMKGLLSLKSLGAIRALVYGSAPVLRDLLETFITKFGQVFIQIYGQSEAPVSITRLALEEHRIGARELLRRIDGDVRPHESDPVGDRDLDRARRAGLDRLRRKRTLHLALSRFGFLP